MRRPFILLLLVLLLLSSCGSLFQKPIYRIGIDSDFASLELNGMQADVQAYCNELFQIIGKQEGVNITFLQTSWDILEQGLHNGDYDAIISGQPGYFQMNHLFDHSSLFLSTGPDLVVEKDLNASRLTDMHGKIIAIVSGSKNDLLLAGYPTITLRFYPSAAEALNSINEGNSDGALIPNLFAQHYVYNLYPDSLKLLLPPLTDAGLRLITLHQQNQHLLKLVDNALDTLRENGKLTTLQKKWSLIYQ